MPKLLIISILFLVACEEPPNDPSGGYLSGIDCVIEILPGASGPLFEAAYNSREPGDALEVQLTHLHPDEKMVIEFGKWGSQVYEITFDETHYLYFNPDNAFDQMLYMADSSGGEPHYITAFAEPATAADETAVVAIDIIESGNGKGALELLFKENSIRVPYRFGYLHKQIKPKD